MVNTLSPSTVAHGGLLGADPVEMQAAIELDRSAPGVGLDDRLVGTDQPAGSLDDLDTL